MLTGRESHFDEFPRWAMKLTPDIYYAPSAGNEICAVKADCKPAERSGGIDATASQTDNHARMS